MSVFEFMLCADDYALCPAISRGILELVDARRINAVSVMTNRPDWRRSSGELARYRNHISIGLHLNLTLGYPLGSMKIFAPRGHFPDWKTVLFRAPFRKTSSEIAGEIGRQIDEFTDAVGAPPDFVDGHHHVHLFPEIRDLVLRDLEHRGLKGEVWLRNSADKVQRILRRQLQIPKALVVAVIGHGYADAVKERGFQTNEGFSGYSAFTPASDYGREFSCFLRSPGSRHLINCHPGYVDAELMETDPVNVSRPLELAFLLSNEFTRMLRNSEARLATSKKGGSPLNL